MKNALIPKPIRTLAAALALWLAGVAGAAAHPHVFVDARTELVFDGKGQLVAVRHVWRFDDAFSAFATQGLDQDADGKFTREELAELAKINVDSLKEYGYFSYLRLADKLKGFKLPSEYWLQMDDGLLTLFYTLPLIEPIKVGQSGITLDVFDPGYFVDFTLVEQEPALLVNNPPGCRMDVQRKATPDGSAAVVLRQIPATERDLPPELQAITRELANRISVTCP